jgi:hypothetical protein
VAQLVFFNSKLLLYNSEITSKSLTLPVMESPMICSAMFLFFSLTAISLIVAPLPIASSKISTLLYFFNSLATKILPRNRQAFGHIVYGGSVIGNYKLKYFIFSFHSANIHLVYSK